MGQESGQIPSTVAAVLIMVFLRYTVFYAQSEIEVQPTSLLAGADYTLHSRL